MNLFFPLAFVLVSSLTLGATEPPAGPTDCERTLQDLRGRAPATLDTPTLSHGVRDFWQRVLAESEIQGLISRIEEAIEAHGDIAQGEASVDKAKELIARRATEITHSGALSRSHFRDLEVQRLLLQRVDELSQELQDQRNEENSPSSGENGEQGNQCEQNSGCEPENNRDQAQQGKEQGSQQGENPGSQSGQEQGSQQGQSPGSQQGQDQESQQGQNPGSQQGQDQESQQGQNPGSQPGQDQGSQQGQNPGSQQGQDQGSQQGQNPGSQSGQDRGSQQGQSPGSQPGQDQGSQQGEGASTKWQHVQRQPVQQKSKSSQNAGDPTKPNNKDFRDRFSENRQNENSGGWGDTHDEEASIGDDLSTSFGRKFGFRDFLLTDGDDDEATQSRKKKPKKWSQRSTFKTPDWVSGFWGRFRSFDNFEYFKPKPFDDQQTLDLVHAYIRHQWLLTLRRLDSSQALRSGLNQMRILARRLANEYPGSSLPAEYEKKATELYDRLVNLKAKYSQLSEFVGRIYQLQEDTVDVMANLNTLKWVLTEIAATGDASASEQDALTALSEFLPANGEVTVSDENLALAYLRTLQGPLSKKYLRDRFPGMGPERIDLKSLSAALQNGSMDIFLYLLRLSSFLDFFQIKTQTPRLLTVDDGPRLPIDDREFHLSPPEDLSHFPQFLQNGPPAMTVERFLSGDILEMTYHETRETLGVVKERDKVVTVLVYDISGSMKDNQRSVIQGALKAAYADRAGQETMAGLADHVVHDLAFGASAREPTKREHLSGLQELFENNLDGFVHSDSDTRITEALIKALETIDTEVKTDPTFRRANILLVTDGHDHSFAFSRLKESREKLSPELEVSLAVISIDEGNQKMDEAVTSGAALEIFDRYQYRHMSSQNIREITERSFRIKQLEDLASAVHLGQSVSYSRLIQLTQSIAGLEMDRLTEFNFDHLETDKRLKAHNPTDSSTEFDRIFEILFVTEFPAEKSKSDLRLEKLNLLGSFLQIIGRESQKSGPEMWGTIGQNTLKRIRKWIDP